MISPLYRLERKQDMILGIESLSDKGAINAIHRQNRTLEISEKAQVPSERRPLRQSISWRREMVQIADLMGGGIAVHNMLSPFAKR